MVSKHISYKEGVYSITALRLGIDNIPNDYEYSNMELTANKIFEPLREHVGAPIKINSFYRSIELNTNAEMYNWIRANLNFDQMIWEFGDNDNPAWVHVSYVSEDQNRNRCLKAYKENGKTKYKVI